MQFKKNISKFVLLTLTAFAGRVAHAVDLNSVGLGTEPVTDLMTFVNGLIFVIEWMLGASAVAAIIAIIIYGYKFIFSVASPDQRNQAKTGITWAIIGLVVILTASLIVISLGQIIGANSQSTLKLG